MSLLNFEYEYRRDGNCLFLGREAYSLWGVNEFTFFFVVVRRKFVCSGETFGIQQRVFLFYSFIFLWNNFY